MDIVISKMMSKPDFQSDFLANILKANANPDIITFAGGLPNAVSSRSRRWTELPIRF